MGQGDRLVEFEGLHRGPVMSELIEHSGEQLVGESPDRCVPSAGEFGPEALPGTFAGEDPPFRQRRRTRPRSPGPGGGPGPHGLASLGREELFEVLTLDLWIASLDLGHARG